VSLNGADFATVTNGATAPNVTRLDREPITAAQSQAILDLIRGEQRLFGWLAALASPALRFLPP